MARWSALLLLSTVVGFPFPLAAQDAKQAITDPADADRDYWYQGEYLGTLHFGHGRRGLQVVALGDGTFNVVEFHGGLPGDGAVASSRTVLPGMLDGEFLRLTGKDRFITIRKGWAVYRDSAGRQLGVLKRVQRVSRTMGAQPPRGAVVLFDGSSTDTLDNAKIDANGLLEHGAITKDTFQDFRLHLEFRLPYMPYARGQGRSNSGVYVQERYEVQVLDSFGLEGAFNECGSLYRTRPPEVNMCFPPLVWQTYDIYFTAPRFDDAGKKVRNARFTVLLNGIPVQSNVELANKTGAGKPEGPTPGKIKFQDHGNPVRFRNIWIVPGQSYRGGYYTLAR